MAELEFIAPKRKINVSFALDPAYNALADLLLLDDPASGFAEWVHQTASSLSPELMQTNQFAAGSALQYLDDVSWPSFMEWVQDLATRDPYVMRDQELQGLLKKAEKYLDLETAALPTHEELLADRERYLELIRKLSECKEHSFDEALHVRDHALLNDPPKRKDLIVTHLRTMWEAYLAPEWQRNLPMLKECVETFQSIDFSGMSADEIILQVADRETPQKLVEVLDEAHEIILIPSAHVGPYLLLISHSETRARMVFGARTPKGVVSRSPELNRTELIARMDALANETRLSILHLLSQEGELGSQDIMARLDLSQSAASRHLQHLKVTGYVFEQWRGGAKYYRINPERIDDMFQSLKEFLQ
jgi:DNA-binding transcriptional ArsR family regulator